MYLWRGNIEKKRLQTQMAREILKDYCEAEKAIFQRSRAG